MLILICFAISFYFPLEIGLIYPLKLNIYLFGQFLQIDSINLHLSQLFLHRTQSTHSSFDLLNQIALVVGQILGDYLQLLHFITVLHSDDFLLFPLDLSLFLLFCLFLALDFFMVFSLDDSDTFVEFGQ